MNTRPEQRNTDINAVERLAEGRRMFILAAATLERDVLLHGLTEDEENVLVGAVLNAADRHPTKAPSPVAGDVAQKLAERFWRIHPKELQDMGLTREQFYAREIQAALEAPPSSGVVEAREAFLNMLADAFDFHDEPDGDETGDHTRFVLVTDWRQLAELCVALGIKEPGYMETWADARDKAIASPALTIPGDKP